MNLKPIIILNCIIFLLAGTNYSPGQEVTSESLKEKRITIKMDKVPLGKVFGVLMRNYDVAIGFEESTFDQNHNDYEFEALLPGKLETTKPKQSDVVASSEGLITIEVERVFYVEENWITINAENSRLEDVLNNIVGQMKYYKWEINDDVVNIYPVQGRDKRFEELLNLEIKRYWLPKDVRLGWVRDKIFDLPEVEKFLDENNLYFSSFRLDGDYTSKPLTVKLDFSNLTFREVLNSIAKAKRGGWILGTRKPHKVKDKEYINILV